MSGIPVLDTLSQQTEQKHTKASLSLSTCVKALLGAVLYRLALRRWGGGRWRPARKVQVSERPC